MQTAPTLVPGYKQVEQFGPDEEYEDGEEVSYVTLDLGTIEPTLVPSTSTYRLIGLDTPTPFLQLSGTVFRGHHDALLGTELLFSDGKDDVDRSKRHISYVATTEQRIRFREVQLKPKASAADPEKARKNLADDVGTLNRITGKDVPKTRRKGKGKNKGKGKEKAQDQDAMEISEPDEKNDDPMDVAAS
ncbi:hypothetical protein PLICRDRAFT_167052 [Plicaturopsis crispa FD-325 SS-3]|uniref:Unplaced genomic scaffold PLICRscaffold_16, whole genome shotgun sequence n=1 Tax=Plicaturopsis crispa FD-325 SS-3 TaxID=944288 RepID=A0A0C9SY25_PLICR|nr:hypothetical protein PLICRDRAFT_167052 [Plicaturopsis crispa FD-325 SS-3]